MSALQLLRLVARAYLDQVLHFGVGFVLGFVAGLVDGPRGAPSLLVAAVGAGKELYDRRHPTRHTFDGWDAYWTVAGGIVGELAAGLVVPLLRVR